MELPYSDTRAIQKLSHVFDNTTATYKFFWMISILQIHVSTGNMEMHVKDIITRMVANAWYPVHYFKLSFGKLDRLFETVVDLQRELQIPIDANINGVVEAISSHHSNPMVMKRLMALANYVPYRFLSPWIKEKEERKVMLRSQLFENDCPYGVFVEAASGERLVRLNPEWEEYLRVNYCILLDFAYWNLTLYLQVRNPNVPAIPDKLRRSEHRHSLTKQRNYWNRALEIQGELHCIYTGHKILKGKYDLDHFIPWSFVSHDLIWNLIPADPSINSSKSNRLPDLSIYLPRMAQLQHDSLKAILRQGTSGLPAMDDYLSLGFTPSELSEMSDEHFRELFERTINPIHQIALNMGFEAWSY